MYKSNAIFMPTFSGPIAVQLTGFLQEKRALGYKYTAESWRLLQIDCLSRELKTEPNTLPQELIDAWCKRTSSESNKTWHARITVTAQLTKYFIAHDLPCAKTIIQTENMRIGSNFVPYIFSHTEMKRLFLAADSIIPSLHSPHRGEAASLLFRMLYSCGLRIGEALELTVKDVDLEHGVITVRNGKGKVDRYVPMSKELTQRCSIYLNGGVDDAKDTDIFFASPNGGQYSKSAVTYMWNQILREAGIHRTDNGPRIHDLRHTFSVHCLKKWVDNGENINSLLPVLSSYLGHANLGSINNYLRMTAEVFPEITKVVEKHFGYIIPNGGCVYEEE
jgi:integrase